MLARQKNHGHFGQSTGTTTAIAIEPGTQKASHTSAPAFAWPMAVPSALLVLLYPSRQAAGEFGAPSATVASHMPRHYTEWMDDDV